MKLRTCLLPFAIALLSTAAVGQDCRSDDFPPSPNIKFSVVRLITAQPLAIDGHDDKILGWAGDSAAVEIVKEIPDTQLVSSEKVKRALLVLRMAFTAPRIITRCSDIEPKFTMILLDHLQNSTKDQELQSEIDKTRTFILQNTGNEGSAALRARRTETNAEHIKWIDSVLRSIQTIKSGMSRKDLLVIFKEEGGLSTRTRRQYVYKDCPYIKVEVEFAPVGKERDKLTESPEDRIVNISKPYLEWSIMD